MQPSPSSTRLWLRLLPMLTALALVLLVAACAPGTPPDPLSTSTPPGAEPTGPAGKSPMVGVDADGNFYRGDLNAPVKLVEFSEFQ